MFKKWHKKKSGSAYLIALGVLSVLIITSITISRLTVTGRWNTIFSSNDKKAEECAEAATNLMFKYVKDKMNDDSIFYKHMPFPTNPVELINSEYMYFRFPAFVAAGHVDGLSGFQSKGMDVQLDLFNNGLLKPIYQKGIEYRYDSLTDNTGPLSPLGNMYKSFGGRVSVTCTAKIKQAFGILADNPKYKTAGVEIPVRKVTGFLSGILDKIMPEGLSSQCSQFLGNDSFSGQDSVGEENGNFSIGLLDFIPDSPNLLKCPELPHIWVITEYVTWDAKIIIQPIVEKIWDKIVEGLEKKLEMKLTPQRVVKRIFKGKEDKLSVSLPFGSIKDRIKEAIKKCLPEHLSAFAGNVNFGITVEKKGYLEVETNLEFYPRASDKSRVIRKKHIAQREFRVADIQPIAPDYTFFVANSKLPYETENVENPDNWEGDDHIDWNDGVGDLVVQNFPELDDIREFLDILIHNLSDFKKIVRNVRLPGNVRINGTKEMQVKIGMLPSFTEFNLENLKKTEVLALALGHKDDSKSACKDKGHDKHNLIPGFHSPVYNFWSNEKSFDWGYFGGGSPGGHGSYWIPVPPRFGRAAFFGNLHISLPFSFRVEGYLKKVYSHIKIHLVQIIIPPIPPWFGGLTIPIPWLWANAYAEPYGFCRWPAYDDESKAKTTWDPNEPANLPANLYSTAQYLKKASYYYNSSNDFLNDINNRSIVEGSNKIFICDGVTFVNDSTLTLPAMKVRGRGIIVCAGNVMINGDIERIEEYNDGDPTIFSIVARNGAIQCGYSTNRIDACLYGDRGIQSSPGCRVDIYGNLCINRCIRSDIKGDVHVHYKSRHTRSSLLSMIRPVAKYDPTRYHVTLSSKLAKYEFAKPQ